MSADLTIVIAVISCGVFVALAEPVAISLLLRAAALDVPNARSSHVVPTPRGGGAPIAAGIVLAVLLVRGPLVLAFGAAVAAFGAIGLAEDLRGLSVSCRLALQGAASLAVAAVLVIRLDLEPAALAVVTVVVALWIAGFVNAFNFMDGVNGISASHAAIAGTVYLLLGTWRPDDFLVTGGGAVTAAALAFLPWNAIRAQVFLGDVGSYGLGAALAVLSACAVIRGIPVEAAAGPLALYLADTAWTLQRRIRSGERWFEPHRSHVYQRWCDAGWSHQRVTAVTAAVTLALCLLGAASLTGDDAMRAAADLTAVGLLAGYVWSPSLLGRGVARLERA